ncbi:MAG: phosphodiester glycosidase family protein [Candidatus Kerfeldbacteria bacterium]
MITRNFLPTRYAVTLFTRCAGAAVIFAVLFVAFPSEAAVRITKKYDSYVKRTITVMGTKYEINVVTIDLANPKLKILTYTGTNKNSCYNVSCKVKELKSYLDEGQGFAAINGAYFCPKDYASCRGMEGGYYWMIYNAKNKTLVNEYQNRFNTGPLITFNAAKQWHFFRIAKTFPGLDALKLVDGSELTAAISNGPAFIEGGTYVLNDERINALDNKSRYTKTNRGGFGIKDSKVYLIIARKATVPDLGLIMKALGMQYAINLDGGGSSALWYRGSYKVGPGRQLPNAIVFSER